MRENSFTDRTVCVTVFRDDGTGVEIREPACIEGRAVLDRTGQPNESFVEILNASEEFRSQVRNDEFRLMRIEAGHLNADNKAVIFEGNIIRSIAEDPRARDNDVSSVIYAGEGQISFRFSTLETTFPTGTTARQAVRAALAKMPEVTEGNLSGLDALAPLQDPYPVYGSVREFFHDLAETADARWSIQGTSLDFISNAGVNETFTVTRKTCATGLFNASLTEHGMTGACLLDPAIRPNAVIEIVNERNDKTDGFWRVDRAVHEFSSYAGGRFQTEFTGRRVAGVSIVEGAQERLRFGS